MEDMPRQHPLHLNKQISRHGKVVWSVRIGKGKRTRLRAAYGSDEFWDEYRAALKGKPIQAKAAAPAHGTLAWLYDRYRETGAWTQDISAATRKQRENIFLHVMKTGGHQPFAKLTQADLLAGRERRSSTPAQARNFLDAMRGLFRWALEAKFVTIDPTAGVSNPPRKTGDGFIAWTEEDVEKYQARWPLGTRQRVWLDVLLYSGLRRGDVVRYGRQHVRNGIGRIKTEKSGFTVTAVVPVLPILAATLKAGPCGEMTFLCGERGKPMTKESFGNMFRDACILAKVPGSAHGVRKIAATTCANNGATVAQLKALFGWTDDATAAIYTKNADTERLGREAGHMLGNVERTKPPSPSDPDALTQKN